MTSRVDFLSSEGGRLLFDDFLASATSPTARTDRTWAGLDIDEKRDSIVEVLDLDCDKDLFCSWLIEYIEDPVFRDESFLSSCLQRLAENSLKIAEKLANGSKELKISSSVLLRDCLLTFANPNCMGTACGSLTTRLNVHTRLA